MKTALIIGNGQSTKILEKFGFNNINKDIDTYCTSLAFRFCEKYNFEPTYYVFADPKSVDMQKHNLKKYINKWNNTKWYLCCNNIRQSNFFNSNKVTNIKHSGSGPGALEIAINKKIYDRILIIGLDHNYTWIRKYVSFLKPFKDYKIHYDNRAKYLCDVVNHPSYFYSNYILKGDIVSWDMNSKDNEKIERRCLITENMIKSANNIDIIDFSENKLQVKKGTNIEKYISR